MRVLQAVTLFSPDGAYGGPVRVALNQAAALRELGHPTIIAAGRRGYSDPPCTQEGTPLVLRPAVRVVPRSGFAGLAAPGLLDWFREARHGFDVAHLHLARDLVMLPFALSVARSGMPFVLQPHGMITPSSHPLTPAFDAIGIRYLLREAQQVFYLTDAERDALDAVARGRATLAPLPNGVPGYGAATRGVLDVPEVLYLARLHPRKRPADLVEAALRLNALGVEARYALVGPDEGEGERVRALASGAPNIVWEGPVAGGSGPDRMRQAAIFVLPSVDEPYPMAVLEAMSVGLPVVITDECGLAPIVTQYRCGLVVQPGAANIADALRALVESPELTAEMGRNGRTAVETALGMGPVARQLESCYRTAISSQGAQI